MIYIALFSMFLSVHFAQARGIHMRSGVKYVLGSGAGQGYLDCSETMKGHESGSGRIEICLEGNGIYDGSAVTAVRDRDWFSQADNLFLATQVDKIKFICNFDTSKLSSLAEVYFPDRKEALDEKKVVIEIPCTYDRSHTEHDMHLIHDILIRLLQNPESVIKKTDQVIAACKKVSNGRRCKLWKDYMLAFFSADLSKESFRTLNTPVKACGIPIQLGMQSAAHAEKKDNTYNPLDVLGDITAPFKRADDRTRAALDLARALTPNCGRDFGDKVLDREECKNHYQVCLSETKSMRGWLKTQGVEIDPLGNVIKVAGKIYNDIRNPENPLEMLAHEMLKREDGIADCIGHVYPSWDTSGNKLTPVATREEWYNAI